MIQKNDIDHLNEVCETLGIKFFEGLERGEAQTLSGLIGHELNWYNEQIKELKDLIEQAYQLAIPGKSYGKSWFIILNEYRTQLRKMRKKYTKLAEIQRKVRNYTKN